MRAFLILLLLASVVTCGHHHHHDDDDHSESESEDDDDNNVIGKYNVLVINPDDMRPSLGCYGVDGAITPNMDKLADKGVTFLNAFVQQPVCNPSRNSFMSGLRPDTIKVWNFINHIRDSPEGQDIVTMPGYFKQKGYFTAGSGKSFHDGIPANYDGNKSWSLEQFPYLPTGKPQCYQIDNGNHTIITSMLPPSVNAMAVCPLDRPDEEFFEYQVTEHMLDAMRHSLVTGQKFFLWAGYFKPHAPSVYPKRFYDMHINRVEVPSNKIMDIPLDFSDAALFNYNQAPASFPPFTNGTDIHSYGPNDPLPDQWIKMLRAGYFGGISWTDFQIGRLLKGMKRLGLDKKTIVIMFSDNGIMMGENSCFIKSDNWDLSSRVPMIFSGPSIPKGKVRKAVVETLDIYPTLAKLAGLPAPPNVEGKDISKIIRASSEHQYNSNAAFTQAPRCGNHSAGRPWEEFTSEKQWTCLGIGRGMFSYMGYTVRTKGWRYTEWRRWNATTLEGDWSSTGLVGCELYDHRSHIPYGDFELFESETDNLCDTYTNSPVVTHHKALLKSNFDHS